MGKCIEKQQKGRKRIGKIIAVMLSASLCFSLFLKNGFLSEAVLDETQAVHIEPEEIETGTLAIGTHLIRLEYLNDKLYELAQESMQESGQTEWYYKSELGENGWYALGGADSLQAILPDGKRVGENTIAPLFFTHHTRSDGVTYDLRTGEAVNPFDIPAPYDRETLPELEPLRNQREMMKKGGADTGFLESFFKPEESENGEAGGEEESASLRAQCDKELNLLYEAYLMFAGENGSRRQRMILLEMMEETDAKRRLDFNTEVKKQLEELLDQVTSSKDLSGNTELVQAIGDCIQKLQSRMDELEGLKEPEQADAMSQVRKELAGELLELVHVKEDGAEHLSEEQRSEIAAVLDTMAVLADMEAGISKNPEKEKEILEERLLPKARELYEKTKASTAEQELNYYNKLWEALLGDAEENEEEKALREELALWQQKRLMALDKENLSEVEASEEALTRTWEKLSRLTESEEQDGGDDDTLTQEERADRLQKETEALREFLEKELGSAFETADKRVQSTALSALTELCEQTGDGEGTAGYALLKMLAEEAAKTGSGAVFPVETTAFADTTDGMYAPADKAAKWCSMRYVYNRKEKQAILAKGSRYYKFEAFSEEVVREKGKTDSMDDHALFRSVIWLPAGYLKKEFGCEMKLLKETGYALFTDDEIQSAAKKLAGELLIL